MKDSTLEGLRKFATDRQREYIDALLLANTQDGAADDLGINRRTLQRGMKILQNNAADRGYDPENNLNTLVAEGQLIKGISRLEDENGVMKLQWVKTDREKTDLLEAILVALDNKIAELPSIPSIKPKKTHNTDLCALYTITDFHLGMYAWDKEAGENWDTAIAEKVLINTFQHLMDSTPDTDVAVLNQLGDFLHWDGLDAVTPTSGHALDADSRFGKMIELGMDLIVLMIEMLLKKHKKVKVIVCEGNHDLAGSVWLQKFLMKIFAKNKRVEIDDSAFPFYAHQHGNIMLGFHHGHKVKNKSLPAVFSAEPRFRKMWGDCEYTYIHTGHYHHAEQDIAEGGGAIVERHPTLAARDAYSARGGYVSWRAARAIVYHKDKGEVSRATSTPIYSEK